MKLLKLSFLFVLILSVAACNEDEPEPQPVTCSQSDWLGTYSGKVNCNSDPEEDVVFTITASQGDSIIVAYEIEGSGDTTTFDPMAPGGCNWDVSGDFFGLTISSSLSLNGDNLTHIQSLTDSASTVLSQCVFTTTRD